MALCWGQWGSVLPPDGIVLRSVRFSFTSRQHCHVEVSEAQVHPDGIVLLRSVRFSFISRWHCVEVSQVQFHLQMDFVEVSEVQFHLQMALCWGQSGSVSPPNGILLRSVRFSFTYRRRCYAWTRTDLSSVSPHTSQELWVWLSGSPTSKIELPVLLFECFRYSGDHGADVHLLCLFDWFLLTEDVACLSIHLCFCPQCLILSLSCVWWAKRLSSWSCEAISQTSTSAIGESIRQRSVTHLCRRGAVWRYCSALLDCACVC